MSDIIKENPNKKNPSSISIEGLKKITNQIENCIYKIQNDKKSGTGFICRIPFLNDLKILITNYSVLDEKDINNNKNIIIKLKRDNMDEQQIIIDNTRIKTFINQEITIIEIKPNKDGIFIDSILDIDTEEKDNNNSRYPDLDTEEKGNFISSSELENKKKYIYIIDKDKLTFSYDIIDCKNNQNIDYYSNIEECSVLSPILSLETFKIFGIYFGNNKNKNYNIKSMTYLIDELNKKNKIYKNEFNLIYIKNTVDKNKENIFGDKFVNNHNPDHFELIINGDHSNLVNKWILEKGENNIKMIIKNKTISNFESMFEGCSSLRNISELEYLDTRNTKFFSNMFSGCSSLSDIKPLENWDVSNANNFSNMFSECKKLSDIRPLKKWNVSKVENFSNMFSGCSLSDIKPLEDWNVSNAINFSYMFKECSSLNDIKSLTNWNVSKVNDFSNMFSECISLNDIKSLTNWDVSKVNDFSNMFYKCSLLSNIKPLEKWKVSNAEDFSYMFSECKSLSDIGSLTNWDVSKAKNFSNMFRTCKQLSNLEPLKDWKVSKEAIFKAMFHNCTSLSSTNPLKNWKLPDNVFEKMFN